MDADIPADIALRVVPDAVRLYETQRSPLKAVVKTDRDAVTPNARLLMIVLLAAVQDDPHFSWHLKAPSTLDVRLFEPQYIADILTKIAIEEHVRGAISTFDILHWLTRHLAEFGPIEKD